MKIPEVEDAYVEAVERKAQAHVRAQKRRSRVWHHVGLVSALAWTFVLPVVVAGFVARWAHAETGRPLVALGVLLLGVVVGLYASYRQVMGALAGDDDA